MKNIWIVLVVAGVAVGGYFLLGRQSAKAPMGDESKQIEKAAESIMAGEDEVMKEAKMVEKNGVVMEKSETIVEPRKNIVLVAYENNVFTPAVVTVKVGDTVKFVNKHTFAIRVASNPHPIHTSYPKLDSDRLEPGQSYEFVPTEKVTIQYHNHFNPIAEGKIVVE